MKSAPAQPADADVAARMAARYGTDRSNWPTRVIAAIVIAGLLGVAGWAGWQISSQGLEARVVRWQVESERVVAVDLEVRGSSHTQVSCAVRVKDPSASDVGYAFVSFDHSPAEQSYRIPTVVAASSVEVLGCAGGGDPIGAPPADYPPGIAPESTAPLD